MTARREPISPDDVIRPFRWDVTRAEQLGQLPDVIRDPTYPGFEDDLLTCSARVLAFCNDSDLVFVGRSPECLFDLLSGLLEHTSWRDRSSLLNVSLQQDAVDAASARTLLPYLASVGLDPSRIVHREREAAFIDVVDSGGTFGELLTVVRFLVEEAGEEWRAAARKIRVVGLTWRQHTSPNTRRWQQHASWVQDLRPQSIKNVSAPPELLTYLAAHAPKATEPFPPSRWDDEDVVRPLRDKEARQAVALALYLFRLGRAKETRLRFAAELGRQPAMRERWFRSLILELKH